MNNITIYFGAPGCGKTRTLIDVMSDELKSLSPKEIAFVSFTRKGAYVGRDRAKERFNYKDKDFSYFGTLHRLAFRELGLSRDYDSMSEEHYKDFSEQLGMKHNVHPNSKERHNDTSLYLSLYSLMLNNNSRYEQLIRQSPDLDMRKLEYVTHNYCRYKQEFHHRLDYNDIIIEFIKRNKPLPGVKAAFVDEAQDLTTLQWKFCEVALRDCERIYIGGDDDQAIFEWSGADIDYFLNLKGKRVILDKSYRLKRKVLDFSKQITAQIEKRVHKDFAPIDNGGNISFYNSVEELEFNNDESYCLLARNNYSLDKYKVELEKKHIVYEYRDDNAERTKDRLSVSRRLIDAIEDFERLRNNKVVDDLDRENVEKYIKGKINLSKPWQESFNMTPSKILYYDGLLKNNVDTRHSNITISTIHRFKGEEKDNVVLLLDTTKRNREALRSVNEFDAEMRCLYVACTRAKKNLHFVLSNQYGGYDNMLGHFAKKVI